MVIVKVTQDSVMATQQVPSAAPAAAVVETGAGQGRGFPSHVSASGHLNSAISYSHNSAGGEDLAAVSMDFDDSLVIKHITLPILAIMMIGGNGLLIFVMLRNKSLRTVTNYFIVSLAFSDLLMGCPVLPLLVAAEEGLLGESPVTCLLVFCLAIMQVLVSCLVLMSIAVERYIAIVRPLWHHTMLSTRNAIGIIAVCWVYGLFVGCLPLFGWNAIHFDAGDYLNRRGSGGGGGGGGGGSSNAINSPAPPIDTLSAPGGLHLGEDNRTLWTSSSAMPTSTTASSSSRPPMTPQLTGERFQCRYHTVITGSYAAFMYPGHFVLLWVCLIILYGQIYVRSRHHMHHRYANSAPNSPGGKKENNNVRRLSTLSLRNSPGSASQPGMRRAKENWRALRIIAAVVGYFLLSWLGMVVWYGIWFKGFTVDDVGARGRDEPMPLPAWFYSISVTLAFGNSAVNPFIYGLGNRSVRRAGLKMLTCRKLPNGLQRHLHLQRQASASRIVYHGVSLRKATTSV